VRLTPSLHWSGAADRTSIDSRLLALLARIDERGSLRAACTSTGMPYRTAWGLLQDIERTCGAPLVRLQRGRGAALTAAGAALLHADEAARRKFAREFESMAVEIGPPDARHRGGTPAELRLAASHDLALAGLRDALPAAAGTRLNIEFCGSLEALARFKSGDVDVAGFHFVPGDAVSARPFLRHLQASHDRLLRLVDREQGLIVARGNPHRVRRLQDAIDKQLRFVNRQSGSGTRMLIDALLAREGREAGDLRGYLDEEFTHAAVAATIASGRADVGFGVAAAAAEYALGFVPVVRERYYLVVRDTLLRSAPIAALRESLAGPIFRQRVGRMVGYDASHAGELERIGGYRKRSD